MGHLLRGGLLHPCQMAQEKIRASQLHRWWYPPVKPVLDALLPTPLRQVQQRRHLRGTTESGDDLDVCFGCSHETAL